MLELNTFSIAARCERTGMLGVAVSTAVPGVGGLCPFIAPHAGAVSTQSWVNPYLGIDGVTLMANGMSARAALKKLIAGDPGRDVRQVGLVDKKGQSAAFTGKNCVPWAGHLTGKNFAVQGNMLVGEPTVQAMADRRRIVERSLAPGASGTAALKGARTVMRVRLREVGDGTGAAVRGYGPLSPPQIKSRRAVEPAP